MKSITPLAILVLVVIAGILGYSIYKLYYPNAPKSPQLSSGSDKSQQQPYSSIQPTNPPRNVVSPNQPPWFDALTPIERSFFDIPSSNASLENMQKYSDLILKNTKASSELSILKDCQPSPLSLSVDDSLTFKVVNKDTDSHILKVGAGGVYSINAGATSTIKLNLDKKPTLLRYSCDDYGVVGFLLAGQ